MDGKLVILTCCFVFGWGIVAGQRSRIKKDTIYSSQLSDKIVQHLINARLINVAQLRDSADIIYLRKDSCGIDMPYYFRRSATAPAIGVMTKGLYLQHPPWLRVHGYVMYNLDYRGVVDTPFQQRDVYQHTVQTYLEITYKDKYPVRIYFTNRFSNSVLFRNFSDVNLQFSPQQFHQKLKERIKEKIKAPVMPDELAALKDRIKIKRLALDSLNRWMASPGTMQRMIEARERKMLLQQRKMQRGHLNDSMQFRLSGDSAVQLFSTEKLNGDSLATYDFIAEVSAKRQKLDSLQSEIAKLEKQYQQQRSIYDKYVANAKQDIDAAQSVPELRERLRELQIADTLLPKGYKHLFALKSFGLGRNIIDYSELSAKNISVTGVAIEYNPSWYVAFATGAVDYRFRDYMIQRASQPRQYLNIVRVGKGIRSRNNVILTVYQGKRQLYNISTIQGQAVPNYRLMGYTVEGTYRVGKHIQIVGEVAKSSLPYYSPAAGEQKLFAGATRFDDRSNEAYSLKLFSFIPGTNTRINGAVKHFGSNFQSFSVFTSGSSQTNWNIRVDQFLFKKKLSIAAGLRSNEFSNPYIGSRFKSSAVFKSLQATLRMKRLPVVSVGYYPSSQLTSLEQGRFIENQFYTLTATLNHFYRYQKTLFNTAIVYTQFYNKATDSGFTYFNSKNFLLSQNVFVNKFTGSVQFSALMNTDYSIYTTGVSADYQLNERFSFGGGLKYNEQTVVSSTKLGYSASLKVAVPKVGEFRLYADKGFIPSANKQLITNNMGQLTYYKTF